MNYTPRQIQIMQYLRDFQAEHQTAPTLEEIGTSLGVHRVTVHQHIRSLVKKGALRKLPQRSRSIEIADPRYLPGSLTHVEAVQRVQDLERALLEVRSKLGSVPVAEVTRVVTSRCKKLGLGAV